MSESDNREGQPVGWLETDPDRFSQIVEIDALLSLRRALRRIDCSDRETEVVELITKTQRERDLDTLEAARAAGVELSVGVVAVLLLAYLYQWPNAIDATLRLTAAVDPSRLPFQRKDDRREQAYLLHWIFEAASGVASLKIAVDAAADNLLDAVDAKASQASASFRRLARVLSAAGASEDALACALSGVNLAARSRETIESVNLALTLLGGHDDQSLALRLKAREADVLLHLCRDDPQYVVAAFDAIESLVRHAADASEVAAEILPPLVSQLHAVPALHPLILLMRGALGEYPDKPEVAHLMRLLVSVHWDIPWLRIHEVAEPFADVAIQLENLRHGLEPIAPAEQAETRWATWAFDYPPFRRAVPLGKSIASEPDFDELLLTVVHETIHVLSMGSGLGRAIVALRLALLELEFRLWTYMGPADPEAFTSAGVAPLRDGDIAALVQAEAALEITRKLKILADIWSPWLEGLAVFGEVAADAPDDASESVFLSVLANLVDDEPLRAVAAERGCTVVEAITERRREATTRYADAGKRQAADRLIDMLTSNAHKYFPGYLTVRAIVARWRQTCAGPCNAQMAFRVLLHVTRYGTDEAIPDLALSHDAFRHAALDGLRAWLRQVAAISTTDLEQFRDPPKEGEPVLLRWIGGRLTTDVPDGDVVDSALDKLVTQTNHALMTLAEPYADLDRVGERDSNDQIHLLLKGSAQALSVERFTLADPHRDPQLVGRMLGRTSLMPIGRATCPFWLLDGSSELLVLVCTSDPSPGVGSPRHQLFHCSLPEHVARDLEHEMGIRRASRMTVARMADILVYDPYGKRRVPGANYLVFAYGNWVHVEPRGLALGAQSLPESLAEQARERIQPDSILDFESGVTAEGAAGALRTRTWINNVEEWTSDSQRYDADPWAAHVAELADEVLTPDAHNDVRAASDLMLSILVGHKHIDPLRDRGLEVIRTVQPTWIGELARALLESSHGPVANEFLDQHSDSVNATMGALFSPSPDGWDVQPINEGT